MDGIVYNIQRMSTKDGPGLRTTVFLKGCPLHCPWCSNPESQNFKPQLMFFSNLCVGCGVCERVCPNGAVVKIGDVYNRDRSICTDCGLCVESCPSKAREMAAASPQRRERFCWGCSTRPYAGATTSVWIPVVFANPSASGRS